MFNSEEILRRPTGRLGEEMYSPAAEFMRPGWSGVWLFQTLFMMTVNATCQLTL
jgi:hypothetical protein